MSMRIVRSCDQFVKDCIRDDEPLFRIVNWQRTRLANLHAAMHRAVQKASQL